MHRLGIVGAGDLGAGVARRAAERGVFRQVVLLDVTAPDLARGKALDLLQSGPVTGCTANISGSGDWADLSGCDAVVVAVEGDERALVDAVKRVGDAAPKALVVVAVADGVPGVQAARGAGLPRERVLGSAPVAWQAAVRHHLALELGLAVRDVHATVAGRPPARMVVPRATATAGGVPVDALSPVALRRAVSAAAHAPGPVALAAAAVALLAAAQMNRPSLLPVFARLEGEYGQRGPVAAVPAQVGGGALRAIVEVGLLPVERIAFDNAIAERSVR